MKLNIYKNQREIEKTYEIDNYDLMYGTVEDVLEVLDAIDDLRDEKQILTVLQQNRCKLDDLLLDMFGGDGLTRSELRKVKLKELVPLFIDLFRYVRDSFRSKN